MFPGPGPPRPQRDLRLEELVQTLLDESREPPIAVDQPLDLTPLDANFDVGHRLARLGCELSLINNQAEGGGLFLQPRPAGITQDYGLNSSDRRTTDRASVMHQSSASLSSAGLW